MKRLRIVSDVVTSRGIFSAGSDVVLDDAEADSCIKNGLAELVAATIKEGSTATKPVTAPSVVTPTAAHSKKKF